MRTHTYIYAIKVNESKLKEIKVNKMLLLFEFFTLNTKNTRELLAGGGRKMIKYANCETIKTT